MWDLWWVIAGEASTLYSRTRSLQGEIVENEQETISLRDFLSSQAGGKYTTWAENLDEETLSALLWALGEFGYRSESASEDNWINIRIEKKISVETGGWPAGRIGVALTAITEIVGGKKMTLRDLMDRIAETLHR